MINLGLGKRLACDSITGDLVESAVLGIPQSPEQQEHLERLFAFLFPLLQRLARRICGRYRPRASADTADDLVVEAMLHFLDDSRGNYWRIAAWLKDQRAPFEHYAAVVAARKMISLVRSQCLEQSREVELIEDILPGFSEQDERNGDLINMVTACMGNLQPEHSQVLHLMYVQGLSGTEVAAIMHRKPNSVYQLAYRAKAELRQRVLEAM